MNEIIRCVVPFFFAYISFITVQYFVSKCKSKGKVVPLLN
jgi:hypothetical protein